ncbi:MAG: membrane integrity-associated transporter subunit PqiC [Xanthomonadales bacterium]|nr:membrane integrity-associated transporter subunit PqiC [Xanthomonadales bacterium]
MKARTLPLLATVLLLAGCTALTGPRKDFTLYALDPPMARGEGTARDWQLLVEEPHVGELLDGFRLVVAPGGNELQVYQGARWTERTPAMLQGLWIRAFEADGRLPGAARAGTGVRADLILASDLTRFQASYRGGMPTVEIELHVRLVDPRDRRIRGRQVFRAEAAAADNEIPAVVAAFEQGMAELNPQLVAWVLGAGDAALAARGSD